jgi:hypothetical protein
MATRQVARYICRSISARTEPVTEIDASNESLTDIIQPYFEAKQPVLVRQAMKDAPAIQKWTDWSYLESVVDMEALCHVEIGGNYAQSNRAELRFGDYLAYLQFFEEKYGRSGGEPSPEDLVYLAQNDIVRGLDQDFELPSFVSELGEGKTYSVMMWIGPHGCVSPLHFDPLDNAFMQFVGKKKALLYPPGTHVYAGDGGNQENTSPINFEEPLDLDEYPQLEELPPALVCTIAPGDLLYMPRKWWHQVRTVENSLSINAWWR